LEQVTEDGNSETQFTRTCPPVCLPPDWRKKFQSEEKEAQNGNPHNPTATLVLYIQACQSSRSLTN